MRTETEIKSLPLIEQQKLVVELRTIKPGDKAYANAKAIIELITSEKKKWKEPETIEVTNITDHLVSVDGTEIAAGGNAKVYTWQYHALARFLQPDDATLAKLEAAGETARKKDAEEKASTEKASQPVDIAAAIKEGLQAALAELKKAPALLLFAFLLAFGFSAGAQVQTTAVGSANSYHVYYIAGLSGGTNALTGTNSYASPVYVTNQVIVPNWNSTNGVQYNTPITNNIISTNIPGLLGVVNEDLINVFWGYQLNQAGTGTATATVDYSADNVNWQTSALTLSLTAAGTTFVSTNAQLSLFAPGYLRFNTIQYPSATIPMTNVVLEVGGKASKTGPF